MLKIGDLLPWQPRSLGRRHPCRPEVAIEGHRILNSVSDVLILVQLRTLAALVVAHEKASGLGSQARTRSAVDKAPP